MSEHTPGPWWYQEKSDAYTHIIRTGENRYLGSMAQSSSPESEANARLAAASPDLYAFAFRVASQCLDPKFVEQAMKVMAKAETRPRDDAGPQPASEEA